MSETTTADAAADSDGVMWRPMRAEDALAVADLLSAAAHLDDTGEHLDVDDVREEFVNDLVDLQRDTLLAWVGDDLAGVGHVSASTAVREQAHVWCSGAVHPDRRRLGIGRRLMTWQLERGAELRGERHPQVPADVMVNVSAVNAGAKALAEELGLEPVRDWFEMSRALGGAVDVVIPPSGVTLVPYEAGRDDEVRQAHNAAFAEHFGSTERTVEEWRHYFTGARAFRPELSVLAVDDASGELCGYALAYVYDADVESTGRRQVWLGQIGTRPVDRGRGAGRALLAHVLAVWTAAGHEEAWLGVDSANGTGALGLYQRAGFGVRRRSTSWAKHLPPPRPAR